MFILEITGPPCTAGELPLQFIDLVSAATRAQALFSCYGRNPKTIIRLTDRASGELIDWRSVLWLLGEK